MGGLKHCVGWVMARMAIVALITFSLTVGRSGQQVMIRYPSGAKLTVLEMCLTQHIGDSYRESCWEPRKDTPSEEVALDPQVSTIQGILTINEDGHREVLRTPVVTVHPQAQEDPMAQSLQ